MQPSDRNFARRYGPWALVTGASSGIGAGIATELAGSGLNLFLVARSEERLTALATACRKDHGFDVVTLAADLGLQDGIQHVLASIDSKDIGLYVACAGFGTAGPFVQNTVSDELNMIDVNCRALAALVHPIARKMMARGQGGIILMSSIVAVQGVANAANYAATKAYVQTFAEGLAKELVPRGVDVLASAPGPVDTGFAERADMRMSGAASPQKVATATLQALGKGGATRPGAQSKLLGYSLAMLPRSARSRIMGQIMTGMTKHHDASRKAKAP